METITFGFIGFGEASYHIAGGLLEEGARAIHAFDIHAQNHPLSEQIQRRSQEIGVILEPSLEDLIRNSHVIVCATSAKAALPIAKEAAQHLTADKLYVDLNAASPSVKQQFAQTLGDIPFVDVAVVESVPAFRHRVPLLISGNGAPRFAEIANRYQMQVTLIGEQPGSASAIKMARSIFMKGLTMLLLETLSLSRHFGVEEEILASIGQSLTSKPFKERANLLLSRTAIHAERRVAEMEEVLHTLRSADLDGTMSEATRNKLATLVDIGLASHFHYEAPEHYAEMIDAIRKLGGTNAPGEQ